VYPAYIDSNKTRVDGRRVPKSRAVDKPTCSEICDVLTAANFKVGVEPKFYPREPSKEDEMRGRVRVQLKNEDGTPVNPAFPSRKILIHNLILSIQQLNVNFYSIQGIQSYYTLVRKFPI
jgi:signal recognition particle subunit SRP19